jgi:hypothetical protein
LIKRFIDYAALSLRANCVFNVCPVIRERLGQIPDKQYNLVEKCFANNASYRNKREELQQKKETLKKAYNICHGNNTTDMISMAFNLTPENISSTTFNSVIGDSIYSRDIALEGWATAIPENFDFTTLPSGKKKK